MSLIFSRNLSPLTREIPAQKYFSQLLQEQDSTNVMAIADSLHKDLLDSGIKSSLLGVGSILNNSYSKRSQSYNDIDLKLLLEDVSKESEFYTILEIWGRNIEKDNLQVQYTPPHSGYEHNLEVPYNGRIKISPRNGKTIDLIVKDPTNLTATDHIMQEEYLNNSFTVIYRDN